MKTYDLVCTGLTFCDLVFQGLGRIPGLGEEIGCEDFSIHVGGAANTPMAASRLGLRVAYVSAVGADDAGALVTARLARAGLDTTYVRREPTARTCVTAVLSTGGDRGFASYFAPQDYGAIQAGLEDALPRTEALHASLLDLMHLPLVALAREHGCRLSIDTNYDEALPQNLPLLRGVDTFFLNRDEMERMTGESDPARALDALRPYVGHVVLKLGSAGAVCLRDGSVIRQSAYPAPRAVDTTGAGDCFCAGYLYALAKGLPPLECLRYGNAAGSVNVRFAGGMDDRLTLAALRRVMDGEEPF